MPDCPSEVTLRLIGADAIGADTFAALEAHIEGCPDCRATLERLAREGSAPPWRGGARGPGRPTLPTISDFLVERELGRGSYGVVYLAREPELDRHVALKVVPGGPLAGPRGRVRWLAEARAVSRLRHPNVVRLYRVDETDEWLVLVLEYVPGGTLRDRLDGPVAPREAAGLVEAVALAVDEIHRSDLLHLDLKPSNILLDGDPDAPLGRSIPKVSDFGIARASGDVVASATATPGPKGTPSYMAPEQAVPGIAPIGPAADVYALGAVLYHALTGRPPFQAPSVVETLDQVRREEPVPPRRLNPRIAKDLETICLACLRKEPGRRYASARALADDLRLWLDGRAIRARPSSTAHHLLRWVRRRPAVAGLAAALIVTMVASVVGLLALLFRSEAARDRAEQSQKLASRSIEEFRVWISGMLGDKDPFEAGRFQDFLRSARDLTAAIRQDDRLDPGILASLAALEQAVAWRIHDRPGRHKEASALTAEAVRLLGECARRAPGDPEIRWQIVQGVLMSGQIAGLHGFIPEAEGHYSRAVTLAQGIPPDDRRRKLLFDISGARRLHAYGIGPGGDPEAARRLAESDLLMLRSAAGSEAGAPDFLIREALDLALLMQSDRGLGILADVLRRPPREWLQPQDARGLVAEWLALEAAQAALGVDGHPPAEGDGDPESWATAIVDSLDARCDGLNCPRTFVPLAVLEMARHVQFASMARRRDREMGEARRIEGKFMSIALQLVGRYPDRAESHMALSEAYVQMAKNASRSDADHEVSGALLQAREAACHALGLAPDHDLARRLVGDRDRRLTRHMTDRKN